MNARTIVSAAICLLGWAALGNAQAANPSTPVPALEIHGTVLSGKTPLPGVAISAANSLTGKKVSTSTDADGNYLLVVPGRGKYVVRALELAGLSPSLAAPGDVPR